MIATRIDNSLRDRLFGLFLKSDGTAAEDFWKRLLMRSIEDNTVSGIAPDRFVINIPTGMIESSEQFELIRRNAAGIINKYCLEMEYKQNQITSVELNVISKGRHYPEVFSYITRVAHAQNGVIAEIFDTSAEKRRIVGHLLLEGKRKYIIGRSDKSGICLEHRYISGHHAIVSVGSGGVVVRDLNSTNGTIVNGRRLEPNCSYTVSLPASVTIGKVFQLTLKYFNGTTINTVH